MMKYNCKCVDFSKYEIIKVEQMKKKKTYLYIYVLYIHNILLIY
jgi:hypothetical protein